MNPITLREIAELLGNDEQEVDSIYEDMRLLAATGELECTGDFNLVPATQDLGLCLMATRKGPAVADPHHVKVWLKGRGRLKSALEIPRLAAWLVEESISRNAKKAATGNEYRKRARDFAEGLKAGNPQLSLDEFAEKTKAYIEYPGEVETVRDWIREFHPRYKAHQPGRKKKTLS